MEFTRQVGQQRPHKILGAVGGAGVDDAPRTNQGSDRFAAATDDMSLVANDHGQHDRRVGGSGSH